jgi:hypothetical protein
MGFVKFHMGIGKRQKGHAECLMGITEGQKGFDKSCAGSGKKQPVLQDSFSLSVNASPHFKKHVNILNKLILLQKYFTSLCKSIGGMQKLFSSHSVNNPVHRA